MSGALGGGGGGGGGLKEGILLGWVAEVGRVGRSSER